MQRLADASRVAAAHEAERKRLVVAAEKAVGAMSFGKQRRASTVTLPLLFERQRASQVGRR